MHKEKALKTFRTPPENHNCAQCIAAAFDRNDLLPALQNCGVGRAPDGMCGAIYAASLIVPAEKRETLLAEFSAANGSTKCRELKQQFRVPCPQCVAAAADILESKI